MRVLDETTLVFFLSFGSLSHLHYILAVTGAGGISYHYYHAVQLAQPKGNSTCEEE